MARTIRAELSRNSMSAAIQQVEEYKIMLQGKINLFLARLAEKGIEVADIYLGQVTEEDLQDKDIGMFKDGANSIQIILSGSSALFIEFGAGITYSNPQNPKAAEMGMGVGTYPDQKNAFNPKGWWYTRGGVSSQHSYGNRPYMPMYNAAQELMNVDVVKEIAKEVFGS